MINQLTIVMENNKSSRSASYLLLLLLLGSIAVNVYQWKSHNTTVIVHENVVDSMISVRVELEKELATTGVELEKYRGMSAQLDSLLNDANNEIAKQEIKIRKLIASETNAKALGKKLEKELAALRKLRDEYLEQIDQLITENKELKAKNDELNTAITNLSEDKKSLQKTVATASQLKAEYIKVSSFKKRGSGKYVESSIAKRTNKIDVCFTVMDNKVAPAGERMLHLVIKEPTGKILAGYTKAAFNEAETGNELSATASMKINYNGEKQDACLHYENDERILTSGNYNIEVYIDGTLVATSAYFLK